MEWDYPRALPQTFPLELNQTLLPLPHFLNPLTTVGTEVTQTQYTSRCHKARKTVRTFRPFQAHSRILQMGRLRAEKKRYYLLKTPQHATVRHGPATGAPNDTHHWATGALGSSPNSWALTWERDVVSSCPLGLLIADTYVGFSKFR